MPTGFRGKPYVIVLMTVLISTLFRMALTPLFGVDYPYITFFPPVSVAARYVSARLAVITVFSTAIIAIYFFVRPVRNLMAGDWVGLALFSTMGLFIAWLSNQEQLARQASTRGLQKSEEQAKLLDLAQDAILSLRLDGTIEFWNRGAQEIYGY